MGLDPTDDKTFLRPQVPRDRAAHNNFIMPESK